MPVADTNIPVPGVQSPKFKSVNPPTSTEIPDLPPPPTKSVLSNPMIWVGIVGVIMSIILIIVFAVTNTSSNNSSRFRQNFRNR